MIEIQNENYITVKPSLAAKMINVLLDANQPVMLHGNPGIGKSDIVDQITTARSARLIDTRISTKNDVDLMGIPLVANGRTDWATPAFFPTDPNEDVVWLFDEFNRGQVSVMNATLQLMLDRRLGDYVVPPRVRLIAAVNDQDVGVNRMPAALLNRFVHVYVEVDHKDWLKWSASANVHPVTQAFIRFRPELLNKFDAKATAFPTPRSWEFVSRITAQDAPMETKLALYAGTVGRAAATEYTAFEMAWRDLPSITNILLHPDTAPVPTGVATVYAVANALAHEATTANLSAVVTYLERLPAEYQVFAISLATQRDPGLASTHRFVQWASKNADLF